MARVWREGQKRPVFVYRLVTADHIEEAIYQVPHSPPIPLSTDHSQRQRVKEGLHSVIALENEGEGGRRCKREKSNNEELEDKEEPAEDEEGEEEQDESDSEANNLEELSPLLGDGVWTLVWPTGSTTPLPPQPARYEDDLLETIAVSCAEGLKEIVPVLP
jgi:hypothetical protein